MMKTFNFIFSLFLLSTSLILPQWHWQNPLPQGNRLEQVQFVDDKFGWMLTKAGTLMRTTDGGNNWNEEIIGKLWSQKIHFIDRFNGWCVGSGAPPFIKRTQDGGKTWHDLPIPNERNDSNYYNFWDVFFIDTLQGYFVDSHGAIFHTSNGGQFWILQFQNSHLIDLNSIYFIDSLKGFAAGYDQFMRTDNGGELWHADSSVIFPFNDDPRKIQFIDDLYGWIMSTQTLFRTTDRGDTWTEIVVDSNWLYNHKTIDMIFIDPKNGWVSTYLGLYQSADSGKTWTNINPNFLFKGIHFFSLTKGWSVADNKHYFTSDGGLTWNSDYSSVTGLTLYGVDFVSENQGWAVGSGGEIIHTTDGGNNWQHQNSGTTIRLKNVEFRDNNLGWVVGFGGITLRTDNGGDSWEQSTVNSDYYLEATSFVTPQRGWAVGWSQSEDTGVVLHTTNGGLSWINQSPLNAGRLFGVCFVDSLNGWIASGGGTTFDKGEVHRTTDGGNTWTLQVYEPEDAFGTIIFADSVTGWIASDNGLLKTTNGGESWIRRPAAMDIGVDDIHFIDTLRGWASGFQGRLSYTTDGGESWVKKRIQTTSSLYGVDFVNEYLGWVVGNFGAILNTTNGGVSFVESGDGQYFDSYEITLFQNYPNPFNPTTQIKYSVANGGLVTLKIYDVLGREVSTLVNEVKPAGNYEVQFNAEGLPSGIYFFTLSAGNFSQTKKLVLLK